MAFEANNLTTLVYGGGFTLWHYRTGDSYATVATSFSDAGQYFNSAFEALAVGDWIALSAGDGSAHLVVTRAERGVVETKTMYFMPVERAQPLKAAE